MDQHTQRQNDAYNAVTTSFKKLDGSEQSRHNVIKDIDSFNLSYGKKPQNSAEFMDYTVTKALINYDGSQERHQDLTDALTERNEIMGKKKTPYQNAQDAVISAVLDNDGSETARAKLDSALNDLTLNTPKDAQKPFIAHAMTAFHAEQNTTEKVNARANGSLPMRGHDIKVTSEQSTSRTTAAQVNAAYRAKTSIGH